MTMHEHLLAVQLMSEERVGKALREHHRRQNAEEDAARRRLLGRVT